MALSYYITARRQLRLSSDENATDALARKVREAFSSGVDYVQLREKDMTGGALALLAEELASCPEKNGARLLVNERWDIAVSCGADGVHLPADSLPLAALRRAAGAGRPMLTGVSCHSETGVAQAVRDEASYVLLSPIFETPSKPGAKTLGIGMLAEVCERFPIPIYALGGIDALNAEDCIRAGAAGVAGIRLFQDAPDLKELCSHLRRLGNANSNLDS